MAVVRRRRLTRGETHATVERALSEAEHLTGLAARALFDDVERGGDVLVRLQREAGAPRASAYPLATVPVLSLLGVVGVHSVGRGVAGSR
jgi:hypothetical protein